MFYVYDLPRRDTDQAINLTDYSAHDFNNNSKFESNDAAAEADIDFVDDALLNTAPHNAIEQQLLRGDMVGLALMSGAILWSAMGAFG